MIAGKGRDSRLALAEERRNGGTGYRQRVESYMYVQYMYLRAESWLNDSVIYRLHDRS